MSGTVPDKNLEDDSMKYNCINAVVKLVLFFSMRPGICLIQLCCHCLISRN